MKKITSYGVRLDVQIRLEFLDVKHFKHLTIKFALVALSQNLKMTLIQKIAPKRFMKKNDEQRIAD